MAKKNTIVVGLDIGTSKVCAVVGEMTERGVEFNEPPNQMPYGIDSGFRDPSGNSVRLTQLAQG